MLKHLCGQCSKSFRSESAYLKHHCSTTGYSPVQAERHNPETHGISKIVFSAKPAQKLSETEIITAVRAARQTKQYNA